ncbi:MAG TPA: imidazole glycerol phosphate synthase subunit HisH [Vicinamibacterales bacterium]|nr:imidazole glycerol phosphate synthase subunit HisH [Vicinamibacterales bacterium]
MRIALIDYGAGNLTSVLKGFRAAGDEPGIPGAPADLAGCAGIVVPGVGHFAATSSIADAWRAAITRRVEAGVPFLGICLGMQWLFEGSEEAPGMAGLGLLAGRCARIEAERPLKVPHVGWNALDVRRHSPILDAIEDGTQVYFTHSFAGPVTPECCASTTHGQAFAAVVQRDNVAGVQFHPEKSGAAGLRILRNFLAMTRS